MEKKKMLAGVFESQGNLLLKEVDVPLIIREIDVIIKVEVASICGTDIHILSVPPNFEAKPGTILGHELVGTVVEKGKLVHNLEIGDKVVVDPNEYCGICEYCKMNLTNLCPDIIPLGVTLDGAFAPYVKTAAKVVHKIPKDLSPEDAVFSEPLADVINGIRKLCVNPWETVVVLGAGPIGQLFMKLLTLAGALKVIVVELSEYRTKIALKNGARIVVNPKKENLKEFVYNETKIGADVVIDTVGSMLADSLDIIRKGGRILLFGCNTSYIANIKQFNITFNEIQIFGNFIANCYFPEAIKLIDSGKLELENLITHRFALKEIHKGIELLRKGQALKVIINF